MHPIIPSLSTGYDNFIERNTLLDSFNGKKILEDDFSGKSSVNKLPLTERFAVLILT